MSIHLPIADCAPATVPLGSYEFALVASLIPQRDALGTIEEFRPQEQYTKVGLVRMHEHGHGPFCKFRISAPKGLVGVYALVVADVVNYIGECEDLRERFNARGYGTISPRNCYVGGQSTNCKINSRVLDVSQAGGRVNLYFYATAERKVVERQLLAIYSPCWNAR